MSTQGQTAVSDVLPGVLLPSPTEAPLTSKQIDCDVVAGQRFPDSVIAICQRPIPREALKDAPRGMTSIKSIFITERLNEAFGMGRWEERSQIIERNGKDVVVRLELVLLDYPWFRSEAFGGNNNADLGDAYKGACTDALSKIAATKLEIGIAVYKGEGVAAAAKAEKADAEAEKKAADEKKKAAAAQTETDRGTVANPPPCFDCKKPIQTWVHPTNNKRYDAADLTKNSQKKYQCDLCGECQTTRAVALKKKSGLEERTQ
jgi:hypothetical protein